MLRAMTYDVYDHALTRFFSRTSKRTGRPIAEVTVARDKTFFNDDIRDVFCSGLTGDDLMRRLDEYAHLKPLSWRHIGLYNYCQFARYNGLIDGLQADFWKHEAISRRVTQVTAEDKILQPDDLSKVFNHLASLDHSVHHNARLHLYVALSFVCGARRSALSDLRMDDFSLTKTELVLKMPRLKSPSLSKLVVHVPLDTVLPHNRTVGDVLYTYLSVRTPGEHLFNEQDGSFNDKVRYALGMAVKRMGDKLGVHKLSPHSFRYTFASMVSDYVGIRQAQAVLGHANITTTQRYAGVGYSNMSADTITSGFSRLYKQVSRG
jgi:integrase